MPLQLKKQYPLSWPTTINTDPIPAKFSTKDIVELEARLRKVLRQLRIAKAIIHSNSRWNHTHGIHATAPTFHRGVIVEYLEDGLIKVALCDTYDSTASNLYSIILAFENQLFAKKHRIIFSTLKTTA